MHTVSAYTVAIMVLTPRRGRHKLLVCVQGEMMDPAGQAPRTHYNTDVLTDLSLSYLQDTNRYAPRKAQTNVCEHTCNLKPCMRTHLCHTTLASVAQGESPKRLAPPRNTKDREHLHSTQTTANRHCSQTRHQAPSKGHPKSQGAYHQPGQQPCTPLAQQPPVIITHTQKGHCLILSTNPAQREAQAG